MILELKDLGDAIIHGRPVDESVVQQLVRDMYITAAPSDLRKTIIDLRADKMNLQKSVDDLKKQLCQVRNSQGEPQGADSLSVTAWARREDQRNQLNQEVQWRPRIGDQTGLNTNYRGRGSGYRNQYTREQFQSYTQNQSGNGGIPDIRVDGSLENLSDTTRIFLTDDPIFQKFLKKNLKSVLSTFKSRHPS